MDRFLKGCSIGVAVAMICFCMACERAATQEGEMGNLEFSYQPADGSRDFERPMAVGSGMSLFVESLADHDIDRIRAVSVEPRSIFEAEIVTDGDPEIYLWADAAGEATIEVEVSGGGDIYFDRTTLSADWVEMVEMRHRCTDHRDAAYLVDRDIRVDFERQTAAGDKLVGEAQSSSDAEFSCQAWISPEYFQQEAFCDEAGLHFWPFQDTGPVYVDLHQDVSRTSRGLEALDLHIIAPRHVDFDYADGELRVGSTRYVTMSPIEYASGGRPICTPMELDVEILTPHFCTGTAGRSSFRVDADDENQIALRGEDVGLCQFSVEIAGRPDLGDWRFDAPVND